MVKLIEAFFWSCFFVLFTAIGFKNTANAANCTAYEIPHLLEMVYNDEHIKNRPLCLATAISKTEVLTNVNCMPKTAEPLYVRKANLQQSDPENLATTIYKVANFTSKYNIHFLFTMYDNVAKVTLNQELPECIVPARKIKDYSIDDDMSFFYGRYNRTINPLTFTLSIEQIPAKIIPNSECNEILGPLYDSPIPKGITDTQLCFRYNKTQQQINLPMLGGPLQVKLDDGYGIIGTVSYFQSLQDFGLGIVTPVD